MGIQVGSIPPELMASPEMYASFPGSVDPEWYCSHGRVWRRGTDGRFYLVGQPPSSADGGMGGILDSFFGTTPAPSTGTSSRPNFNVPVVLGPINPGVYSGPPAPFTFNQGSGNSNLPQNTQTATYQTPTQALAATSDDVRAIQRALNNQIGAGLSVDGKYGPLTTQAVRNFQSRNGLSVTGVVDAATRAKLFSGQASSSAGDGAGANNNPDPNKKSFLDSLLEDPTYLLLGAGLIVVAATRRG